MALLFSVLLVVGLLVGFVVVLRVVFVVYGFAWWFGF